MMQISSVELRSIHDHLNAGNGRVIQTTILLTQPTIYIVVAIVWQSGTVQANILSAELLPRASAQYIYLTIGSGPLSLS